MSASHRKISRLNVEIFQDLVEGQKKEQLKTAICNRLKRFAVRTTGGIRKEQKRNANGISSSSTCSIKTIGQLLRLSPSILLVVLDPILTYEAILIFLDRVCNQCCPKPKTVLRLLQQSTDADVNANNFQLMQRKLQGDLVTFGNSMRNIPSNIPSLDRMLQGGIRLATLTELVGRSGTGKTQLACQLCISAARFNQGAIYIDTEKKLSLPRLREMSELRRAQGRQAQRRNREQCNDSTKGGMTIDDPQILSNKEQNFSYNQGYGYSSSAPDSQPQLFCPDNSNDEDDDAIGTFKKAEFVLGNLTVHQPGSSSELLDVLDALEDEILQRNQAAGQKFASASDVSAVGNNDVAGGVRGKYPVRLLIVDSIAAPMRKDFGSDSAPQRASAIFQFAQKSKRLADQLHLAVVVINQAGGDPDGISDRSASGSVSINAVAVRPALGMSWHHCVSTRLVLETAALTTSEAKVSLNHSFVNGVDSSYDIKNNMNSQTSMQNTHGVKRKIAIVKSNKTEFGEANFKITSLGIIED